MLSPRRATDLAFWVGLTTAPIWCGAQTYVTRTSMNGVSLAQYFAFIASFVLSSTLAFEARRTHPGRVIEQQIISHGMWSLFSGIMIGVVILSGRYHWSPADTRLGLCVLLGIIGTLIWKAVSQRSMMDPAIRGLLSISLKALPQFLLVPIILVNGGSGYHWSAILMGNVSIMTRLIPLFVSIETEGMNLAKWWLLAQDILNEASWAAVSVAWLLK
jgi:hypothetical protein